MFCGFDGKGKNTFQKFNAIIADCSQVSKETKTELSRYQTLENKLQNAKYKYKSFAMQRTGGRDWD